MRFRRRPPADAHAGDGGDRESLRRPATDGDPEQLAKPSVTGTYLTDGRSLFRIQHAITEADGLHLEEPLLELEDCATLELILCSAGALERLGLRAVDPSSDGERERRAGPDSGHAGPLPVPPVRL
jgi:hypothetical protein